MDGLMDARFNHSNISADLKVTAEINIGHSNGLLVAMVTI